jgi:NTE family protein
VFALSLLGGCATRPINPPIAEVELNQGYRYLTHEAHRPNNDTPNLVIEAREKGWPMGIQNKQR